MTLAGPTSHVYVSQRLRLHYVDWGNSEAPPLLLLHGWRDHCRNWDWIAQRLRDDWHIIAPDLRGHGDSAWTSDGQYSMPAYVYDLSQLIHQLKLAPARIVAHSLGGHIALRYSGLYPENVSRLAVIEGLGPLPGTPVDGKPERVVERMTGWLDEQRTLAARQPKRYATIDEAFQRMHAENRHLSPAQARHLTSHGVNQNEDGTYSWKFDNYVRALPPNDIPAAEMAHLWSRIACPTLLVYGKDSWAANPLDDGHIGHFRDARVETFERAGHWVHHDRTDDFVETIRQFL
ncbi:alpha/beta fold hydrolase [Massilia cavernae]|uniref:Alpha/beta hydrolase n=1 Tax=Massilia cavernae TaxID=2320864 RepID=A0A418X709_9BURK|nr:alpha/beta hydrolase [Massilia cavernae]RJG08284.1 alpha/beta hydrolase [Massilia cavernae]